MATPEAVFRNLINASSFQDVLATFSKLCQSLNLYPEDSRSFYLNLKNRLRSNEAKALWDALDARWTVPGVYEGGSICQGVNVSRPQAVVSV